MYYLIYKITNKLNGKFYIGKHKTSDLNDSYMGSGKYLWNAIDKHGIENFEKTILFECTSEEEMNAKEKEIVNEDFVAREDTYNLKVGGDGGWDYCNDPKNNIRLKGFAWINHYKLNNKNHSPHKHSKEVKEKISKSCSERIKRVGSHWLGRKHSEEVKRKIGQTNSQHQSGKGNSNYGKHWWMNPETGESRSIREGDPIPEGWIRGRRVK